MDSFNWLRYWNTSSSWPTKTLWMIKSIHVSEGRIGRKKWVNAFILNIGKGTVDKFEVKGKPPTEDPSPQKRSMANWQTRGEEGTGTCWCDYQKVEITWRFSHKIENSSRCVAINLLIVTMNRTETSIHWVHLCPMIYRPTVNAPGPPDVKSLLEIAGFIIF